MDLWLALLKNHPQGLESFRTYTNKLERDAKDQLYSDIGNESYNRGKIDQVLEIQCALTNALAEPPSEKGNPHALVEKRP